MARSRARRRDAEYADTNAAWHRVGISKLALLVAFALCMISGGASSKASALHTSGADDASIEFTANPAKKEGVFVEDVSGTTLRARRVATLPRTAIWRSHRVTLTSHRTGLRRPSKGKSAAHADTGWGRLIATRVFANRVRITCCSGDVGIGRRLGFLGPRNLVQKSTPDRRQGFG